MNYDYLDYFRKAYELSTDPETKQGYLLTLQEQEAFRDFYTGEGYQIPKLCFIEQEFVHPLKTGSLKQIKHLIQFDRQPNHDLTETKEELYKISVSFPVQGEL